MQVSPGYLPASVPFQLSVGTAQCPSSVWLTYRGGPGGDVAATTKAAFTGITGALLAGHTVRVTGNDDCSIQSIYFLAW